MMLILLFPLAIILITLLCMFGFRNYKTMQTMEATADEAKEAMNRMSTWAMWMTGLQTAEMAAMGLISERYPQDDWSKAVAYMAFILLGMSIVLSTWLLSCFSSVQLRLHHNQERHVKNDIYEHYIFQNVRVKVGRIAAIVHTYFLIGTSLFAIFAVMSFKEGVAEPNPGTIIQNMSAKE